VGFNEVGRYARAREKQVRKVTKTKINMVLEKKKNEAKKRRQRRGGCRKLEQVSNFRKRGKSPYAR